MEKHELVLFLNAAKNKGLYLDNIFFPVLAYSGMRVGEFLALKWKDINFQESTINITKTLFNPKNSSKKLKKAQKSFNSSPLKQKVLSEKLKWMSVS
ncbi:tyrosine-type recombinase/integrase [Halalkalibacter flavus]|uniref:tyrosine-type recombinase/integrase n=1 Tax=Halalkalibacter flavus TaxID=3090668 RepID=UPI002FC84FFB